MAKVRLQKIIAQAGLGSRRQADEWVKEGRVTVNGVLAKPGDQAIPGKDAVKVGGKLITHTTAAPVYYLLNKPKGVIAMLNEDPEGRPTLAALTRRIRERVFPIGRMDFNGEGAMLLTNDGALAFKLQKDPTIIRTYRVKTGTLPTPELIQKLVKGGRVAGRSLVPHHIRIVEKYRKGCLIEVSFEGLGQIDIRKLFENKGFRVERVVRQSIGHLSVAGVAPGGVVKLRETQVTALLRQPELAQRMIDKSLKKKSPIKIRFQN